MVLVFVDIAAGDGEGRLLTVVRTDVISPASFFPASRRSRDGQPAGIGWNRLVGIAALLCSPEGQRFAELLGLLLGNFSHRNTNNQCETYTNAHILQKSHLRLRLELGRKC